MLGSHRKDTMTDHKASASSKTESEQDKTEENASKEETVHMQVPIEIDEVLSRTDKKKEAKQDLDDSSDEKQIQSPHENRNLTPVLLFMSKDQLESFQNYLSRHPPLPDNEPFNVIYGQEAQERLSKHVPLVPRQESTEDEDKYGYLKMPGPQNVLKETDHIYNTIDEELLEDLSPVDGKPAIAFPSTTDTPADNPTRPKMLSKEEGAEKESMSNEPPVPPLPPRRRGQCFGSRTFGCLDQIGRNSLQVSGFQSDVSDATIRRFFEEEKLNGGSTISNITFDKNRLEAIIEFEDPEAAQKITEKVRNSGKKLTLDRSSLEITLYNKPMNYKDKLIILDLSSIVSEESLRSHIENVTGASVKDLEFGHKQKAVVVSFNQHQDVPMLLESLRMRKFKGSMIKASELEISRYIQVGYLGEPGLLDDVRLYLSSVLPSVGEHIENIVWHPDYKSYIVAFENWQDAYDIVEKSDHKYKGIDLKVRPYFTSIDAEPHCIASIPKPFQIIGLDPFLIRFMKQSMYNSKLKSEMEKIQGRVEWPTDETAPLRIMCDVQPMEENSRKKVSKWKAYCRNAFDKVLREITERRLHIARDKEVLHGMFKSLRNISTENDNVGLVLNDHEIIVFGQKEAASKLALYVSKIIDNIEKCLFNRTITKSKIAKRYEVQLLESKSFVTEMKKIEVGVSINPIDNNTACIYLEGKKQKVDIALGRLYKILGSYFQRTLTDFALEKKQLLKSGILKTDIYDELKKRCIAGSYTHDHHDNICIFAFCQTDLNMTEKILKETTKYGSILLETTLDEDGQHFINVLNEETNGLAIVNIDTPSEVTIAAKHEIFRNIYDKILLYLDSRRYVTEFMELESGKLRYIQTYKNSSIVELTEKFTDLETKIIFKSNDSLVKIVGEKRHVRNAISDINMLVHNVIHIRFRFASAKIKRALSTDGGMEQLRTFEIGHKCVIQLESSSIDAKIGSLAPKELAEFQIQETAVYVMRGDITSLMCDAIVVPTTSDLQMKSGAGRIIRKKGGFNIQIECDNLVGRHGHLEGSQVHVTSAGQLAFKKLMHVVMKTESPTTPQGISVLQQSIMNALNKASAYDFISIGVPLEIVKSDVASDESVKILIDSIAEYLTDKTDKSVKKIFICDIVPERTISALKMMKKNKYYQQCLETFYPEEYLQSEPKPFSCNTADFEENEVSRTPYLEQNIAVNVIVGELSQQEADVIVNSTNASLDLNIGSVSRSLLLTGGEIVQEECNKSYPNGLQMGEIAITSAGKLKCKHLFHGRLDSWDNGQGHAERVLSTLVDRCLFKTDELMLTSVAFPALGTGGLGFPPEKAASVIFKTIDEYEAANRATHIKKIDIVVWSGDKRTTQVFQKVKAEKNKPALNLRRNKWFSVGDRCSKLLHFEDFLIEPGKHYVMSVNELNVEIVAGDITKEMTSAIVNSLGNDANLSYGNVSSAILKAAGPSIQDEFETSMGNRLEKEMVVVTNAGNLYCKKILHIRARTSSKGWEEAMKNILNKAEEENANSLSFPALGTGAKGCKPDLIAQAMRSSILEYARSKNYRRILTAVRIVIYNTDMIETFLKVFNGTESQSSGRSLSKFFGNTVGSGEEEETLGEEVTFHVYANSLKSCENIRKDMQKLTQEL